MVLIFANSTVCGQVIGLGTEQEEKSLNEQLALDTTFSDTLQVKQRIEEGIKKYGKENLKQVLLEMLYDDIKKIVDEQGPNPMDVLYDKMIQDLSEEAQGKENHAVEYYSKAFSDSLMQNCIIITT